MSETTEPIELPCAVVHPDDKPALAKALGISADELDAVIFGIAAYVRDDTGARALKELAFDKALPDRDFGDFTCADNVAAHAGDLVRRHIALDPARARLKKRKTRIEPPIDEIDVAYLTIVEQAAHLKRYQELDAPEILIRNARVLTQQAFEALVSVQRGALPDRFEPYDQLMTGGGATTECVVPNALYVPKRADAREPYDCYALSTGYLVLYPFATVALTLDGTIRDVFPTSGLRPVGDNGTAVLFVAGGGPAATTGYFDPAPVVRDLDARRWLTGARPADLPRYVAGTVPDVKWAIVADLDRAKGYRISPAAPGDQCGGTTTSLDGEHAYDSGGFVVETATGKPVLDARFLGCHTSSFVRREDGAWRFLGVAFDTDGEDDESDAYVLHVLDEKSAVVRTLQHPVGTLTRDGKSVLCANADELVVLDVDSGEKKLGFNLVPLHAALLPPADAARAGLWAELLAIFGTAERVAGETPASLRAALVEAWVPVEHIDDAMLDAAIAEAKGHPALTAVGKLPPA